MHTEKVNTHLDETLNYIHHVTLMTQSPDNDTYTYKTMLQHNDRNELVKATMKEIVDHEDIRYCSMVIIKDLPPGAKTILDIVPLSVTYFLVVGLRNIKLEYVHVEECRYGRRNIGKHMPQ